VAQQSKPVLLIASSGIASALATLLLLTWGARPAADSDGFATAESASTASAASPEAAAAAALSPAEDPVAALQGAARLRAADERRRAVLAIGRRWAAADPESALAMASTLPSMLRVDYLEAVSREWANLDPDGFLRHAESGADREALLGGLELLIASEPFRVFGIVSDLARGPSNWTQMQMAAATAMAEQNVMLALQTLETAPRGIYSDSLLSWVLHVHGRKDPDAALAWLESLDSPSAMTKVGIFGGIAQTDFARGYRLLVAETTEGSLMGTIADLSMTETAARDPASASRIAGMLLDIGTGRARSILEEVIGIWARRDPATLVDWMIDNAAALEPQLARSIGLGIATNDLESALRLVDGLPPAIGHAWVPQMAGSYALQDPRAALDWVSRYQGQAFYDEALGQVVLQGVERDPELVVSMLPGLPAALQASAVPDIAAAWVLRDPGAAANWVAGLEGPAAEAGAAREIINGWMRRDLGAATQWALDLQRGSQRDDALASLVGGSYGVNFDPRPIFEEIESADARQRAAVGIWAGKQTTDPDLARDFLESLRDDEQLGEWARERLTYLPAGN
jgi:hypothetical protein